MLRLTREVHQQLLGHARSAMPAEAVGLLGGLDGAVTVAVRLANLAGPGAFRADPRAQFLAQRQLAAAGLEVLAIYHSHPGGGAVLSARDLEFAAPWQVVQVVVAVARPWGRPDEVRAFRPGSPPTEVSLQLS
jgi:proteasome lid subunit RPN8/RPN11